MHLRRALILFAIVLGVAALAASVFEPRRQTPGDAAPPASVDSGSGQGGAGSAPSADAATISFDASEPTTRNTGDGRALTILVKVPEPGLVQIPELGLIAQGDPLTPARFELLAKGPGSYSITFSRGTGQAPAAAGTLVVP